MLHFVRSSFIRCVCIVFLYLFSHENMPSGFKPLPLPVVQRRSNPASLATVGVRPSTKWSAYYYTERGRRGLSATGFFGWSAANIIIRYFSSVHVHAYQNHTKISSLTILHGILHTATLNSAVFPQREAAGGCLLVDRPESCCK